MESRLFIKSAAALISRIKDFALVSTINDTDDRTEGEAIQKQVAQLFSGLQNPTLPSAHKLRDVALRHGFHISPPVLQRLQQGDQAWY